MARKLILKEDGLNGTPNSPVGYRFIGYDNTTASQKSGSTISGLGGQDYTETIVNISSAQILAMGSSPIQLLPAAGANSYYDYYGILEFTYGTSTYNAPTDDSAIICDSNTYSGTCIQPLGGLASNEVYFFSNKTTVYPELANLATNSNLLNTSLPFSINGSIVLTTYGGGEYSNGDGTIRVKIYHKTITFGA